MVPEEDAESHTDHARADDYYRVLLILQRDRGMVQGIESEEGSFGTWNGNCVVDLMGEIFESCHCNESN